MMDDVYVKETLEMPVYDGQPKFTDSASGSTYVQRLGSALNTKTSEFFIAEIVTVKVVKDNDWETYKFKNPFKNKPIVIGIYKSPNRTTLLSTNIEGFINLLDTASSDLLIVTRTELRYRLDSASILTFAVYNIDGLY